MYIVCIVLTKMIFSKIFGNYSFEHLSKANAVLTAKLRH